MSNFLTIPRSVAIGHLDRWMNKKSMWTWKECGYQQSNYLFEYTFPEYVAKKITRTMGAAGAPAYCNMLNDIELWVGGSAMELVVADATAHNRIGLSSQLSLQLTYFARSMVDYFESRITDLRSTSPLCGGGCDVAGVDIGGRHGHDTYPASLWPNGNETWDISHARRLVQFVDTMYRLHPDISLPSMSHSAMVSYLARMIPYLMFNGNFNDPAFTNFLNGVNVQYIGNAPWGLTDQYLRAGYNFWAPYNIHVAQIGDAITNILDNKIPTTYLTPGGNPPGGNYDLLGFYSSLTRPSAPVASTPNRFVASVGAVFQGIIDWFLGLFR